MKKAYKKLLHLDQQKRSSKDLEEYEDERQARRETRRKPRYQTSEEVFKCRHCHRFVCPLPYGGRHRNHCPFCLYSRHVDDRKPGDRLSDCGASMEPAGHFQRAKGEYVLVHRCLECGFERFNRIAADDDFDLVLTLPEVPPRTSHDVKLQQVEELLHDDQDLWRPEVEEVG